MINLIFKPKTDFNSSPNSLLEINNEYNFKGSKCGFGLLSKINIFIGENNSGKSRFLRYLFLSNFYAVKKSSIDTFAKTNKRRFYSEYESIPNSCIEVFNRIYKSIVEEGTGFSNIPNNFFNWLKENSLLVNENNKYYFPVIRGSKDYKTIINNKLNKFLSSANSIQNQDPIHHFISLLNLDEKGLDSFDIYNEIIKHEYFKDIKINQDHILTGGRLYKEIKSMLLGDENQRKVIEDFQKFLRDSFFQEYEKVQIIPNEQLKILRLKIGDDENSIYDWGDGTQQLITILFYLYIHKNEENKLFFIEEPELYLHPGILRKFIEILNSETFKNHQYFITTHSNIILDTSADVDVNMSIFKFKKVKNKSDNYGKPFIIEQCNNGDESLLNDLGVRNSSVFLSNCSVWVEGITDRLYLKHYLKLYIDKFGKTCFRENLDYTFIEYGGGNVVHFNFDKKDDCNSINAKYINNKIFLIADNDNSLKNSTKRQRKDYYKSILEENFYELSVVEIENLVSKSVLEKVLISQNKGKEDYIKSKLSGTVNYKKVHLGKFIDELFNEDHIKSYSASSGTIKNKLKFCECVIEQTTDYDMLTKEAKQLTEKIYAFIEKCNSI